MKDKRITSSIKNMAIGLTSNIATAVLGIIRLRMIILVFGSELNGVYQLIIQLVGYLAIAEFNIGQAFTVAAYKSVADDDKDKTSRLYNGCMSVLKYVTYITLGVILVISLLLFFVNNDSGIPSLVLVFYFLAYSAPIMLQRILLPNFAVLDAYQEKHRYNLIYQILLLVKLAVSIVYIGYLSFVEFVIVENILGLIIIAIMLVYTNHLTQDIRKLSKQIDSTPIKQSKYLITKRISELLINNVNNIIITKLYKFETLSLFSSYSYIKTNVVTLFSSFFVATTNGFGNYFASGTGKTYVTKLTFAISMYMAVFAATMCFVGAQPMVAFITSGADQVYGINYYELVIMAAVVSQTIYLLPFGIFQSSLGCYREISRYKLVEAIVKIVFTCLLVWKIGVFGAFLGTIVSQLMVYLPNYYYAIESKIKTGINISRHYLNLLLTFGLVWLYGTLFTSSFLSQVMLPWISVINWLINMCVIAVIVLITSTLMFFLINPEFNRFIRYDFHMVKNKIKGIFDR